MPVFSVSDEVCRVSMKSSVRSSSGGGGDLNAFAGVTTRTKHFWVIAKHPVFLLHAQSTAMLHVCALNKHKCVMRSGIVCLYRAAAVD